MKRRLAAFVALAALCAAGALAALSFAPTASAWSPTDLPPGWGVSHIMAVGATVCPDSYRISSTTTFSDPFCADSPTYQADFDAWVNAHYAAPVTTTETTTAAATTTTPVDTTTQPTTTPANTTTTAAPAAPAQPAQTVTVTTLDPAVTAALTDLQAQINALRAQVSKLVAIVEQFPNLDPAILAALMGLAS